MKDNFRQAKIGDLEFAKKEVEEILLLDISAIIEGINKQYHLPKWTFVCVSHSRAENKLFPSQKLFRKAVSNAVQNILCVEDGTNAIIRHTTVRTTHIKKADIEFLCADGTVVKNDEGKTFFSGITKETCTIDRSVIEGNILF